MRDFVHLHTHTEYSLLDGLSKCSALANHAAELGMKALAITDHGVMYGVVDFYNACRAAGIKPIIGIEMYVAPGSRFERNRDNGTYHHLVLLAQNQAGYLNLLALASKAQLEGFYYKPRVDKELLAAHSEGVIVLSACVQGEIPQLLHQGQDARAREAARWYQAHFPGRFYLELQTHDIPEHEETYRKLIALGKELGVPFVATNDVHYAKREQADAHDVLLCIGTGKTVNEPNRMRMTDDSYYMRSPEEMWALYADLPEALENTIKIADQCEVELQFAPPYHLPKFPVPEGRGTSEDYLRHLCDEGMTWRYGEDHDKPEYVERLEYELGIIHEMGFDDYFLIVWDLCQAAQERDIWWNVRGSGAGSVVAYTLGITNIDPFRNRLLFERFLNPARVSMPDIDLDYPDDRREELIAYTKERYGADHVSAIITFGTLGARAAIRDVGRALDIPLGDIDKIARMVPNIPGKPVSIRQALETIPDLKAEYDNVPYIRSLLDMAEQVEGVTRHASTHAAGVIISDKPLMSYLPLNRPTKGDGEDSPVDRLSQWPMEIVDALGMLKVDFLGLRTLTHMRKTCELIEQEHGRKLTLETIPYERDPSDPVKDADVRKLYDLLATGETTGVFQVEGAGMRRTLRELRPTQFQHIVAAIALYRPGPMENIPDYIHRMHGEAEIAYHHPILADILADTYGIIVYQEQIMEIAVAMAGYRAGEADMIRKAVAKKKEKLMLRHQKMFRRGAIERGIDAEVADRVWVDIEFFARYGFNRAHATDYGVITAQTAYLRAHYPLEFMTALMTTERHNTEKLGLLIADARRNGLTVERPSINTSEVGFTIERADDGQRFIRIGLGAIKNVGDDAMQLVVEARAEGGPFKSLDDFAERVDLRRLNRKALECLIQTGALDDFGERPALMTVVDAMMGVSSQTHSARDVGQFMLFDNMQDLRERIQLPSFVPPIPDRQLLAWEKELLGTYLSKHPLTDQERELLSQGLVTMIIGQHETETPGQTIKVVGMIQRVRRITTKKGDMMAFVTLEGSAGTMDAVVFPRTYERAKMLLTPERVLVACGKLDTRQDREEHSLLVDWFKEPHDFLLMATASGGGSGDEDPFLFEPPPFQSDEGAYDAPPEPSGGGNGHGGRASAASTPPASAQAASAPPASAQAASAQAASAQPRPPVPQSRSTKSAAVSPSEHAGDGDRRAAPRRSSGDTVRETRDGGYAPGASSAAEPQTVIRLRRAADRTPSTTPVTGAPPEPPSPPATLYVTLRRTGDNLTDFQNLENLHRLLRVEQGSDHFVVILEGPEEKRIELEFPTERTQCTADLRRQIVSLVGDENLRVVEQQRPW
ncbi:MAG: DNA polymerase III subunit alpha [Anaerolineae bacterium]|nr:DNA polymerase III subunit alpha [Anaerolineae bacterium]